MLKILLVENNVQFRCTLKRALATHFKDMEVKEASDEGTALKEIDSFYPDLVFMDICLDKGQSGLLLTRKIKHGLPEILTAILSHHDMPEYRSVAIENGADCFFSKSTSLENIIEYVDHVAALNAA